MRFLTLCVMATLAGAAQSTDSQNGERQFLLANSAAMNTMMSAMAIKPSGDVDQDFRAAMIPHHQGAIDMALAELHFGHNERLRRIAQEIIVEQQSEIAAMQMAMPPGRAAASTAASDN